MVIHRCENFGFIAMKSSSIRMYVHPFMCASLHQRSLTFDINVMMNWHVSKQGIHWPVSCDHIAGSSYELTEVNWFFFFFLSWPLTRFWFWIGLQMQPRLTHLNINKPSFFACFLWLEAVTRPYYINYSSYTVNAFCVHVENGLENAFFLHFSLVSIQFDI